MPNQGQSPKCPDDVNPSQWEAILCQDRFLLIVAGPGTGKTHTLTLRIAEVSQKLESGTKVLAITFTNKAAEEMRRRLQSRIKDIDQKVTVGTFHQFCLKILQNYREQAQLPSEFKVASEEQIGALAKGLWPNLSRRDRRATLDHISRQKSVDLDEDPSEESLIYDGALREKGLVDFDDLLLETYRLFKSHPEILTEIQNSYPQIFVDEYQDINPIQHALLKLLVGFGKAITAIGDPNQSIYGFRGSNVTFFESFNKDYPEATVLHLKDNYRSTQDLLTASSQVMSKSGSFFVPELTAKIYEKGQLVIHACATDKAEAEYVVHKIERMIGGTSMFSQDSGRVESHEESQVSFGDVAVLYRLNSQGKVLQEAFERSGIPFHISGQEHVDDDDRICPQRTEEVIFDTEKVSLMSLHAAKGLEFEVVFIVGCEEGLLPLNLKGLISKPEEERRLFYVGMTRAKNQLFLLRAKKRRLYGEIVKFKPSSYLLDIEDKLKTLEDARQKMKRKKKKEKQMTLFK